MTADELQIRRSTEADLPAVLRLVERSMGEQSDPRNAELFRWKHHHNAFGVSPSWVACDGDRIVGVRVFMRWQWREGATVHRAVRAVDTATDPAYQGRGIFTTLTRAGVEELAADGVAFVFNTPNDNSRPGYLKMGWQEVGRLPAFVRPRTPMAALRMARSKVPADKWSRPCTGGIDAAAALADTDGVSALLASQPRSGNRLVTNHTSATLLWRYGLPLLGYRAVTGVGGVRDGLAVWRTRRRGASVEATVTEVLAPGADAKAINVLLRKALGASGADYGIVMSGVRPAVDWLPLPGGGPILTFRPLQHQPTPPLSAWGATLGDIELF